MLATYNDVVSWSFANINLAMILLSLPFIFLHLLINMFTHRHMRSEIIYAWLSLFGVGFVSLFWFVMHVFLADYTAQTFGWQSSLFQYEAGIANLAIAAVGMGSFWKCCGFRIANTLLFTIWAWGLAVGPLLIAHYTFVNNTWFWSTLILPAILIVCTVRMCRYKPRIVVMQAP